MSVSSSVRTVCKEVFDENSAPSEEEIKEYALKIGIDPVTEGHLLHIARDGLMQAVPKGWTPCYDEDANVFYYYNYEKKQTQWDHPLDDNYRNIVKKVRAESISSTGEEDSKTSAKEDLKSFEEVTIPSEMLPKPVEPLKPPLGGGAVRKGSLQLAPLRKPPSLLGPISSAHNNPSPSDVKKQLSLPFKHDLGTPRSQIDLTLKRSISNTELGARSPTLLAIEKGSYESLPARSPSRIDIDNLMLTKMEPLKKKDSLSPLQEKHPRSLYGGELTLKGGGSMFLKSKQKKSEDLSSNVDVDSDMKSIEVVTSESKDLPKGILREPVSAKQLWDVDPRAMSLEEKQLWKKQELEDERKSVRFNLEKDLKIGFHVSDSEEDEVKEEWNSEEQDSDDDRIIAGVKVTDILNRMDSSEIDEPMISEHNVDGLETQVGKKDGEERDSQVITDKLKGLYLTDSRSKDLEATREKYMSQLRGIPIEMLGGFMSPKLSEEVTFLKNIKLKTPQEIKEMNSLNTKDIQKESPVKDATKISEKRQLGSSLFRNDIISKSVENIVLNGDLDKSSLEFGKQAEIMFENNADVENKLEHSRRSMEQQLQEVEAQSDERLQTFRDQLIEEERIERNRLKLQLEKRMVEFEAKLREQQEAQQQSVKDNMMASLNQSRDTLAAEREMQMKILKSEFELKFSNERRKMELECKEKIESLKSDMAEMVQRMEAQQMEEKKKMIEEITAKGRNELHELKLKLEVDNVDAEIKETQSTEQSLNLIVAKTNEDIEMLHESLISNDSPNKVDDPEDSNVLLTLQRQSIDALRIKHLEVEEQAKQEHSEKLIEMRTEFSSALEMIREEHKADEAMLRRDQEIMIERLRSDHVMRLEALRNDCLKEEEVIRREHLERLNELKGRLEAERQRLKGHTEDKDASGLVFEKLRCEKRLLEDKYRTLKDKYVRLKGDVKLSVERRRKRDLANNTGSETERSTSHRTTTDRSGVSDSAHAPKNDNDKPPPKKRSPDNNNGACNKTATSPKNLLSRLPSEEVLQGVDSDNVSSSSCQLPTKPVEHPRKRRQLFTRLNKSASTSRINNNNNNNNHRHVSDAKSDPVENLRRQLQKLDDLEDQFPPASHTDTYLRYPFSDPGECGSSELEFFRHRIHLERESVRRAKDFLQVQRDSFRARQRELRSRRVNDGATSPPPVERTMLDQLADEEKELTDMEVSLHRTRGLLGEKIIRLRHLEQSLHRAATVKVAGEEAATLSDISSHSGGSLGFSGVEIQPAELTLGTAGLVNSSRQHEYRESTEIIQSLENLNTEIHDIWEVLNKARPTAIPPPPLVHPDWLGMPPVRLGYRPQYAPPTLLDGQYGDPSLVERTKTLRDWLRQARIDSAELTSPGQATL